MSAYIQGCLFTDRNTSKRRLTDAIRTISQAHGAHVGFQVDPDDIATIQGCMEELGVLSAEGRYFQVSDDAMTADATGLWVEAYEALLTSDRRPESVLGIWFRSLLKLKGTGILIAVAAFDGSISAARECSLDEGVGLLLASLAKPWHELDNTLYVMTR